MTKVRNTKKETCIEFLKCENSTYMLKNKRKNEIELKREKLKNKKTIKIKKIHNLIDRNLVKIWNTFFICNLDND